MAMTTRSGAAKPAKAKQKPAEVPPVVEQPARRDDDESVANVVTNPAPTEKKLVRKLGPDGKHMFVYE